MGEYSTLKRVIVGEETYENTKYVDYTLKLFFKENLSDFYQSDEFVNYDIPNIIIQERKDDLKGLTKILKDNNVDVVRPVPQNRLKVVKTPDFSSVFYSNSNVRDLCICIQDYIICSFSSVRSRFFENQCLLDILHNEIKKGKKVICPPIPTIHENKIDNSEWRDFNLDNTVSFYDDYEILFDCANIIKVTNSDIIMNIANKNMYNGYKWLRSILPSGINIHTVSISDNHIDGTILPIKEGLFLANTCFLDKKIKDLLPKKFNNWDIVESNTKKLSYDEYDNAFLQGPKLASYEGININVLSLNRNKILVQDNFNKKNIDELEKYNVESIPIKFRHSTIFGGGIHCSTLDLERENE
jgi:glycine amidinotransferase